MNAVSRSSSPLRNRLEGFALTALLQGLPTCAGAVLILRLAGAHEIVGDPGGAAIFVLLASLFHGLLVPWLGPRFPRFIRNGYEPLFFDCQPVVLRQDRAMAREAHGLAAARDDRDHAVAARGSGGERPLTSPPSFRGATKSRARNHSHSRQLVLRAIAAFFRSDVKVYSSAMSLNPRLAHTIC